jgi:solute carrier family 25 2-oxodicarboxylate transporter 21
MEAPKRATKFAANDEWGKVWRNVFGAAKMNQSLSILTGASAGATEAVVVVPFELVKIRLQDKASAGKYNGAMDVVMKTIKQEGVLSLYQGLESTMWRHILWNAGYFGCIFQVRQIIPQSETKSGKMFNDLISGAVGGTVGTILNTPMDVVKSRIQNTPRVAGQIPKYNWAWPSVFTVAREEGFAALYKGFLPKVRVKFNANYTRVLTWHSPRSSVLVPEVVSCSWCSPRSWTHSGAGKNKQRRRKLGGASRQTRAWMGHFTFSSVQ